MASGLRRVTDGNMELKCLDEPVFPLREGFLTAFDRYILENGPVTEENLLNEHVEESNQRHDGECSVCLEELDPSEDSPTLNGGTHHTSRNVLTFRRCGHQFHKDCVFSWMRKDSRCPYCMIPLITTPEELLVVNGRAELMMDIFSGIFEEGGYEDGDCEYDDYLKKHTIPIVAKELTSVILCAAYVLSQWGAHRDPITRQQFMAGTEPLSYQPFEIGKKMEGRRIVEGVIKTARKLEGKRRLIHHLIEELLEEAMYEMKLGVADLSYAEKKSVMRFGRKVTQLAIHAYADIKGFL